MESFLKVSVLAYTPEFEQNIVRGAKLCYSSSDIQKLKDKVTEEEAEKFLNMILEIGHGSLLEHSSITFGIEGVSRSLTHQLVRHRVGCSYSQKSQRYVNESGFDYIVPQIIKNNPKAYETFIRVMEEDQKIYDEIYSHLLLSQIKTYCESENIVIEQDDAIHYFKENYSSMYRTFSKIAGENARSILPNACETKIQVTMNVRALFNFFKERLCNRAQDEIREMAYQMWLACMTISPTIFKHAVPTCVNGKCKEGSMTCGKAKEVKVKFTNKRHFYVIDKETDKKIKKEMDELLPGDIIEMYEPDNITPVLLNGQKLMLVTESIVNGKIRVDNIVEQ